MRIAVIVPCYRVGAQILELLAGIGPEVALIFVVDDGCPEHSGDLVEKNCGDPRVTVIRHPQNRGVGAAMVTGYRAALEADADIVVKLDGDGQMDPQLIPVFVAPLAAGTADYTKGNRFFDLALLESMPRLRLFGNALLSIVNKASSGYWNVMDPTNGYTAIHRAALARMPLAKLARDYFFESDMLFRLYTLRAVVQDVPMRARYGNETSSLRIGRVLLEFPLRYAGAALKRVFYAYFLRDFNAGTLQLVPGVALIAGGGLYGLGRWIHSTVTGIPASSGVVMLAALPVMIGVQLMLSWLHFDIQNIPTRPLSAAGSNPDPALLRETA
ncbi:MAG: glycosyltransferase family 2 protein [Betaproteobacteria bacterium]